VRAVRVRVPGSTSNLGAGFDCLGLALQRYLTADFVPRDGGGLSVERLGTLRDLRGDDIFVRAFRHALSERGVSEIAGHLTLDSEIPVARGMGSSAVAVVGGSALASAVLGEPVDLARVLHDAGRVEGHLDNAAPALLGGLVAVASDAHGVPRTFSLPLSPNLAFVFAAPGVELATAKARAALPPSVPHAEATRAIGRVAALVRALETGDPGLLAIGFADTMHVPYRLPLIPGGAEVVEAGMAAGAFGVTVSGAGSGLFAVTPPARAGDVAAAMAAAFAQVTGPDGVIAFPVTPDTVGTRVEPVRAEDSRRS
jgi:homoserine kinase